LTQRKRIVVVGGGFAGVRCARILSKKLSRREWDVVIFNRENHMVFHPMLAEVAGGSLAADAVAAPLRQMLPRVHCRTEAVTSVDLERKTVSYVGFDGRAHDLPYDHVVLSCGSDVNLSRVPGMADHAFPLKTVGDAVQLRAHAMQMLERAEVCDDEETRAWHLSFVVVGGGFSGVETAGELNDLARGSSKFFQNIRPDDIRVALIHSRDELLPEISPSLRAFTRRKMEKAGVQVILQSRVAAATPRGVVLKDGTTVDGATIVCTIGTSPSPLVRSLAAETEKGRILTDAFMHVRGYDDAWAIGDCALIENAATDSPAPPTGQFADREGRQCAANILRTLRGVEPQPFRFKPLGQLCAIGAHSAVAEIMGMRISGFPAWFLWRTIYLMKLPSFSRKIKVGFDWAWELVFSRDLSHLKTDTTSRVSKAYFRAGDWIFRQGDPAAEFYVIETGTVEIVKEDSGSAGEVIAELGPGEFFGEMALLSDRPRNAGVRAATDVEVTTMGRQVFEQVSSALTPLADLLKDTMAKRGQETRGSQASSERVPKTR